MLTNRLGLPAPLVRAVERFAAKYSKGRADYSATELQTPPLIYRLRRDHRDEITEDVVDRLYALQGQVVHKILEEAIGGADQDVIPELRCYAQVGEWVISGQADAYYPDARLIQDYKTTSVWSALATKPEWEAQLNILAYLFRRNGGLVDRLQIVALFRDWSRSRARQGGDYPQAPAAVIDIPVWPHSQAEHYIIERAGALSRALTCPLEELPQCSPAERWATPSQWAIMRRGRKSAVRLYETREAAQAALCTEYNDPAHYIEERPGEDVRCESYCNVRAWCPYKKPKEETHGKE